MGAAARTRALSDVDIFCSILSAEIQNIICINTNKKAMCVLAVYNGDNQDGRKWKLLDRVELKSYLGLIIVMGCHRSNYERINRQGFLIPKTKIVFNLTQLCVIFVNLSH